MKTWFQTILAALMALCGAAVLFNLALNAVILNPLTYTAALDKAGFYKSMPGWLTEQLYSAGWSAAAGQGDAGDMLSRGDFEGMLSEALTEDWLRAQGNAVVVQLFTQLALNTPEPVIEVDLAEVKTRLTTSAGKVSAGILARWPPCSEIDLLGLMQKAMAGGLTGLPVCLPPEPFLSMTQNMVTQMILTAVAMAPDKITLVSGEPQALWQLDPAGVSTWRSMGRLYRVSRAGPLILTGVLLIAAMAQALLCFQRPRELAAWWAYPPLIGGMLMVGFSAVLALTGGIWIRLITDLAANLKLLEALKEHPADCA